MCISGCFDFCIPILLKFISQFSSPVPLSVDGDIVDGDKVIPAISDDELDHDVAGWLSYSYGLLLNLSILAGKFLGLANKFEAITIGSLASLDFYFLSIG